MSTAPAKVVEIDSALAPNFTFQPEKSGFVLQNGNKAEKEVMFNGHLMTVPARNIVGTHAETDADGEAIPGTYLVEDIFKFDEEKGEYVYILNAKRAVQHILGIKPGKGGKGVVATSPYSAVGLSLLPRHPDKSVWQEIGKAGEHRAFLASVEEARTVIYEYDEMNAKRKSNGMDPVAPRSDYHRAKALIDQFDVLAREEAENEVAPNQKSELDDEIQVMVYVRAKALEMATKAAEGKSIDRQQLARELLGDPAILSALRREGFRIRRKGHMPISDEDLQAAANAGLTTEEAGLEE